MNNKNTKPAPRSVQTAALTAAVEQFIARGGVIDVLQDNERTVPSPLPVNAQSDVDPTECTLCEKVKLLKALANKGAGISALQYALRMNRKDIRKLALDHGVTLVCHRRISGPCKTLDHDAGDVDDAVAGHAMHYSSLGYTAQEIAEILGLSVRQIRDMAQAYRFELRQRERD